MREFKIGEEVVLTEGYYDFSKGDAVTLVDVFDHGISIINEQSQETCHLPNNYVQHKYPNPPHKHKDLIIEWAKGADIGFIKYCGDIQPCVDNTPSWEDFNKYEVIEPTPPKSELELKIEQLEAKMTDIAKQIEELK